MYHLSTMRFPLIRDLYISKPNFTSHNPQGTGNGSFLLNFRYHDLRLSYYLGSRACPGFMFATRVITRVMSCIIANFRIEECQDEVNAKGDHSTGLTRPPVTENYRFIVRK